MNSSELKKLRDWFLKNAAELPWRPFDVNDLRDPYAVWISETMLQQTQVATVRDYFIRWMERFPDIASLAAAEEDEVFKYWQGLGYYSRARNILKTAKIVAEVARASEHAVISMPASRKELEALPGIGAYTAGAILSLGYHQREAILDGNLVRVFARLNMLEFLPTDKGPAPTDTSKSCAAVYWDFAREVADHPKGFLHNEALMELGRTVCKVKNPDCENCPLKKECRAFAEGRASEFPPSKKHLQKDWHGTVLVIESSDKKILAVHGGQKFFNNQFALPHFESARSATIGFPAEACGYIPADLVKTIDHCGSFKHGITVHRMDCQVLYIQLAETAQRISKEQASLIAANNIPREFRWIEKASATETLANSFSLKALKLAKI